MEDSLNNSEYYKNFVELVTKERSFDYWIVVEQDEEHLDGPINSVARIFQLHPRHGYRHEYLFR